MAKLCLSRHRFPPDYHLLRSVAVFPLHIEFFATSKKCWPARNDVMYETVRCWAIKFARKLPEIETAATSPSSRWHWTNGG